MATHYQSILGAATKPDDSGNVVQLPAALNLQANDRYPQMVWEFRDSGTRITLGVGFRIQQNYVGTPKIGVVVGAVPTSGAWRFEFDYTAIADGETADPSSDQESVGATITVPGTARLLDVQEIALTAGNFAIGDWVQGMIVRDGTDAADTLTATLFLLDAFFSYSDA